MKKIERVYIACYKYDYWQTKICVASIRYWYPEIEIFLIKDEMAGSFSTKGVEKRYNVKVAKFGFNKFGWGISKLEPYFLEKKMKVLILDSDIIFLGQVIDYLEQFSEEFIVSADYRNDYDTDWFQRTYYNLGQIKNELDRNFDYPGYVFNTGQLVATSGVFDRSDFHKFVEWGNPPKLKLGPVFACADQGILNYFMPTQEKLDRIKIGKADFMVWGKDESVGDYTLDCIKNGEGYPKLIHWAGLSKNLDSLKGSDIIKFFQNKYYEGIVFGNIKRLIENQLNSSNLINRHLINRIRRKLIK